MSYIYTADMSNSVQYRGVRYFCYIERVRTELFFFPAEQASNGQMWLEIGFQPCKVNKYSSREIIRLLRGKK